MTTWIDQQIGKYEIKELLGQGGMGEVYKAFHPALEREVALKLIHTHLVSDPEAVDRFRREAKVVAALRHPGIVQVFDFDVEANTFYMVMEFIPGQSLQQRLAAPYRQDERLPLVETLRLFRLMTEAVAYAHSQQVIHRDLKPSNVLLTPEDKPVLVDFGLSKIISQQPLTVQGAILGTPHYMSPEQGAGTAVDARSDVYALGVIFYELTTGMLPFSGETPVGLILKHINEPPAPPRSINPDLPPAVEQVIQKALAKEPANRYPSAQELLKVVERLMLPPAPETPFLDETMLAAPDDGRCPYRGLQTFEAEHTQFFFGREALIDHLVGQVTDLSQANGEIRKSRFLAVLGASGSGKSSLVRAGLLPALQSSDSADSAEWPIVVLRPGSRPLEELAAQLAPVLYSQAERLSGTRQLLDNLAVDSRALHLAGRLAWAGKAPEQHLLLVVDQFEEIFTLCRDESERQRFIENLLYAASSAGPIIILLTMRADFYHRCAAYRALAGLLSSQQTLLVGPMDEAELRRAIERPAQAVGLRFEPGLVDTILADVALRPGSGQAQQPGALPLLQHALLELWERRQRGLLTLQAYHDSGGVAGAIAQRAEALYAEFNPDEQALVRRVMLRLTQPGEGTEDTRRRARLSEFVNEQIANRRMANGRMEELPIPKGHFVTNNQLPITNDQSPISQVIHRLTNARLL
jgi:serine/threonine protein kinase